VSPTPILIDCDPGHDDAIALLLALASPEVDILGVTSVAGNQTLDKTTANAIRVLEFAGRGDVPVAAGADRPLVREQPTVTVKLLEGMARQLAGLPANNVLLYGDRGTEEVDENFGPLAPISCVSKTAYARCSCPDEQHCGLRMLMFDVRNAISRVLDRYTLDQIVEITLRKMRRDKVPVPFARRSFGIEEMIPLLKSRSTSALKS